MNGLKRVKPFIQGALIVGACVAARPASAFPIVDLLLTPQGGGVFRYDLTIDNPGPEDLVIVSITDAPLNDPLIAPTLTAPAGFLASYDPGLGFIDAIEATSLFAAGSLVTGFSFESAADPGVFFTAFEAYSDLGDHFAGTINRTGGNPPGVPDSASTGVLLGFGLLGLFAIRRSSAPRNSVLTGLVAACRQLAVRAMRLTALGMLAVIPVFASGHRDAPLTAFDHNADITDVYAFRSFDRPSVTLVLCVDPFLEPANGPNWFPFDPEILYEIDVDNNNDAVADISFQFRFQTEQRLPNLFQVYAGLSGGAVAPANSPPPVAPGTLIVPFRITSFSDIGLGQRQSYTVTMTKGGVVTPIAGAGTFYAVPANAGPRTMDYNALFNAGTYQANDGIRVFAGTTDDPSWSDLGGLFDTFNTHKSPPVLSVAEDAANVNLAADTLAGYAVNSIALEVPIAALTRTGAIEPATSPASTIGVWATTSRPRTLIRRPPLPPVSSGPYRQVQRMANPLINGLVIGTGFKDSFSMEQPANDAQFASFFLDPALARVVNALTAGAVAIPGSPRLDLLPLVTYAPPIAAPGTPAGPIADLLRLNTGVAPSSVAGASRLGLLGGDPAGFPNGRRLFDDVTDIALRLVVGGVLAGPPFSTSPLNARLGDGVNVNDALYRNTFPYLANAPSGRDRRHIDPGESGCTANSGGACLP
jgi:hypothetical protein